MSAFECFAVEMMQECDRIIEECEELIGKAKEFGMIKESGSV